MRLERVMVENWRTNLLRFFISFFIRKSTKSSGQAQQFEPSYNMFGWTIPTPRSQFKFLRKKKPFKFKMLQKWVLIIFILREKNNLLFFFEKNASVIGRLYFFVWSPIKGWQVGRAPQGRPRPSPRRVLAWPRLSTRPTQNANLRDWALLRIQLEYLNGLSRASQLLSKEKNAESGHAY